MSNNGDPNQKRTVEYISCQQFLAMLENQLRQPFSDTHVLPDEIFMRHESEEIHDSDSPSTRYVMEEREIFKFVLHITQGYPKQKVIKDLQAQLEKDPHLRSWERPEPFHVAFDLESPDGNRGRFRAQIYFSHSENPENFGLSVSLRRVFPIILTLSQLLEMGLPSAVETLFGSLTTGEIANGLVVVVGATGSGKTTTVASFLGEMNANFPNHSRNVITLEDPIEFLHKSQRLHFIQVEIGKHVSSMEEGLRGVLRQDPNIVMIGEARDSYTVQKAIEAANTGHLVLMTMHGPSAASGLIKLLRMTEWDFDTIKAALKAVIAQKRFVLAPEPEEKKGTSLRDLSKFPEPEEGEEKTPEPLFRAILAEVIRPDRDEGIKRLLSEGVRDASAYYRAQQAAEKDPKLKHAVVTFESQIARHFQAGRLNAVDALALAEEKDVIIELLKRNESNNK